MPKSYAAFSVSYIYTVTESIQEPDLWYDFDEEHEQLTTYIVAVHVLGRFYNPLLFFRNQYEKAVTRKSPNKKKRKERDMKATNTLQTASPSYANSKAT